MIGKTVVTRVIAILAVAASLLAAAEFCLHADADHGSSAGQHCVSCCPVAHSACLAVEQHGSAPNLERLFQPVVHQNLYTRIFSDRIDHPPQDLFHTV